MMIRSLLSSLFMIVLIGCNNPESPTTITGTPAQSQSEKEVSSQIIVSTQQEDTIEEIDVAYQEQALPVVEQKLKEMNVPFIERSPTFKTAAIDGVRLLEIRYSNSDPNALAGDWILYFDPKKPIGENPVDIKIWR